MTAQPNELDFTKHDVDTSKIQAQVAAGVIDAWVKTGEPEAQDLECRERTLGWLKVLIADVFDSTLDPLINIQLSEPELADHFASGELTKKTITDQLVRVTANLSAGFAVGCVRNLSSQTWSTIEEAKTAIRLIRGAYGEAHPEVWAAAAATAADK